MAVSQEALDKLAVSEAEYEAIVERLEREPNELELGMFGSMWSEHCGYKHSKPLLKMLPSDGPRLLVSTGSENAGAVDVGGGLAVVMKIESHNHPSAVEPYQGAATGVGGIVRDIFSMGARPIALLNSLRFGPLSDANNRRLFRGVVAGIAGYGNCLGIPDVGGEIAFSPSYSGNPLVNAMCVGVVPKDKIVRSTTGEPGNVLLLVGAQTGRDGIHGASGLASRILEEDREQRPAVQVGNPFMEKVLLEACLEVARAVDIAGMQDLGAAGLTSSTVEAAANGGTGVEIDVSRVPRRDEGMTPYEVMLSESQERMLIIVKPSSVEEVRQTFTNWGLDSTLVGTVTGDGKASVRDGAQREGEVPVEMLTDPPLYRPDGIKPEGLNELQEYDLESVPMPSERPGAVLLGLLSAPNIASKQTVFRQYDHQVQTNTVVAPGADAAVLRLKGTLRAVALATDGNGRYCYLDPYVGGMIAVAEACRNVSTVGAQPIALTDCLNFGNPERPETYYQLEECVKGIARASTAFDTPVVSGNVSLYNESASGPIYPTPIIGALGLLEDATRHVTHGFVDEGDLVLLLGAAEVSGEARNLAGSEYLELAHGLVAGSPTIDLALEAAVQAVTRQAIEGGLIKSAHDCSDGGLAVALAECCMAGGTGFRGDIRFGGRWDAALFGETQSRVVVSVDPEKLADLTEESGRAGVPFVVLGNVGGSTMNITPHLNVGVEEMAHAWSTGLGQALGDSSYGQP